VLFAPEMQELFRVMESPDIHAVVTKEFSRLVRPATYADYCIMDQFVKTNTTLYLPDGPIDFATDTGQMIGPLRAMMAGWERRTILDRMFRAKEAKRRRGELAQSKAVLPWGVEYEQGRFFYKSEAKEPVRQAFALVLSGTFDYNTIARMLQASGVVNVHTGRASVTARGARWIMSNPIWMGWRIIDHKRSGERYARDDGRQAQRKKVLRSPDEVIKVKVIDQPLISEADFYRAQEIIARKEARHWRSRPNYVHRFIYGGRLTCARCGEMLYSSGSNGRHGERRDFYVCRGRRVAHRCNAPYMRRERLEQQLDGLFARHFTDPDFLGECIHTLHQRANNGEAARRRDHLKLEIATLERRRARVVDSYIDGGIKTSEERDRRLAAAEQQLQQRQQALVALEAEAPAQLTVAALAKLLAPLAEWEYWSVEQKRAVLATLVPDIIVANYQVKSLGIRLLHRDEERHTRAVSCQSAGLHRQERAFSARRHRSHASIR
jgi:DNA invertase Pin-like site-specific DNA recombinase